MYVFASVKQKSYLAEMVSNFILFKHFTNNTTQICHIFTLYRVFLFFVFRFLCEFISRFYSCFKMHSFFIAFFPLCIVYNVFSMQTDWIALPRKIIISRIFCGFNFFCNRAHQFHAIRSKINVNERQKHFLTHNPMDCNILSRTESGCVRAQEDILCWFLIDFNSIYWWILLSASVFIHTLFCGWV